MRKKCLPLAYTTLMVLTVLLFASFNVVEALPDPSKSTEPERTPTDIPLQKSEITPIVVPDNSVLHLIPKGTLGVIYCSNLLELDNRISALVAELSPQLEIPDVSAKTLAQVLGVEFESLADLEEIGLDLNQDFAILLTSLQPLHFSALAHLTDPEAMKQMIEAKGSVPTQYKGVTYWNTTEGNQSFAILENTLVFSTPHGVCENVIDMHNGTKQTIIQNPNYSVFLTDILEETDQLGVCFDIETAIATLDGPLEEKLELIINIIREDDEALGAIAPFLEDIPEGFSEEDVESIKKLQSISARLEIEGTDVQIKPFLKLRSDSEFLQTLEVVSGELAFLDELPNRAIMNGAVQGCPKLLVELSSSWLAAFPQKTPEQKAQRDLLVEQIKNFHESLVDRWSISVHFEDALFPPNYLLIYELKDEQAARTYMDEVFSEHLHEGGVYAGKSMMHNHVEIKSYIFPDLTLTEEPPEEFPEELAGLMPTELHWYYAFTEGQLLFATGVGPESIQMALERKIGSEEKFSDHPSYQELVDLLGTDNNIFVALSPVISAKSAVPLVQKMDAENAVMQIVGGLFMNLPENYSLGFSAKARDGGIGAKLFLKLGDFKQLTQMLGMLFQAGRMQ